MWVLGFDINGNPIVVPLESCLMIEYETGVWHYITAGSRDPFKITGCEITKQENTIKAHMGFA